MYEYYGPALTIRCEETFIVISDVEITSPSAQYGDEYEH